MFEMLWNQGLFGRALGIASSLAEVAESLSDIVDGIKAGITQPDMPEEGEFVRAS
jgi:hypothetical protein